MMYEYRKNSTQIKLFIFIITVKTNRKCETASKFEKERHLKN